MGGPARPLHDPGNHGTFERRSLRQVARRGRLTEPARPAGDPERPRPPTPPPGAPSQKELGRPTGRSRAHEPPAMTTESRLGPSELNPRGRERIAGVTDTGWVRHTVN